MIIMLVLVEEPLCQDMRGWSLVFENLPTRGVWVRGYVPSCLALNSAASQKLGGLGACLVPKASFGHEAGSAWPGGVIPFILWSRVKARYRSFLSLVLSRWVAPPLYLGLVGSCPVRGVWFPSCLLLV
jgi:hypothetical protein